MAKEQKWSRVLKWKKYTGYRNYKMCPVCGEGFPDTLKGADQYQEHFRAEHMKAGSEERELKSLKKRAKKREQEVAWNQMIPKQHTIGVVGMKRQGKSYWMAHVACPELANRGIPFIVFDMVGGLTQYVKENKSAFIIEVSERDLPGTPNFIYLQQILVKSWEKKQGVVLDCGGLLQAHKAEFVNALSHWIWSNEKVFTEGVIMVDEIHEVVPQDRGAYSPELERLLRQGGNHELAFVMSTQRPATVNKNLWYLTDILIVFRQTYEPDVRPILDVIKRARSKEETDALIQKIASLKVGQHMVIKWTES